MGVFPEQYPGQWAEIKAQVEQEMAAEKAATEAAGYVPVTGWFGAISDEFRKANGFGANYIKDGKIYGRETVRFELGLRAEPNPLAVNDVPADAAYWLDRKEFWKKKLGIDYDTNPPR